MHSYIIVSKKDSAIKLANKIAPYKIEDSIDNFVIKTKDKIGIDTVRQIKNFLNKKPYQNSHKIIYIQNADLLTIQAQNSLLKTLEEPPANSLIFLTTKSIDKLIPTVISRCQIVAGDTIKTKKQDDQFLKLQKTLSQSNIGQKITLAAKYAYPKTKAKDFLENAIYYYKGNLEKTPSKNTVFNLKLAHKTYQQIEKNIDPKLSIEHFFINLKFK